MDLRRYYIFFIFNIISSFLYVTKIEARIIVVDINGNGNFKNIKDGINNSSDGDTVLVMSGIYYEDGILMKEGVTLWGTNADSCIIHGNNSDPLIIIDSVQQCKIDKLSFFNKGTGVSIFRSKALITNVIFDSCFTGIFCRYHASVE